MRKASMFVLAVGLLAGCEKGKTQGGAGGGGGGGPQGGGGGGQATVSGEVRAPNAQDLAEYTKDLPGQGQKLFAKFETTLGDINCELYPDKAPMTVANFIGLATGKKPWMHPKTGETKVGVPYFDGLIFHRVIPEFMVQGGDPLGAGVGGPGYKFEDELSPEMPMGPGTLAMANAGPVTNGSQFFIMDNASRPDLAQKHTIFGMCKELDVVAKITSTPRGARDKPRTPVTMKVVITKG